MSCCFFVSFILIPKSTLSVEILRFRKLEVFMFVIKFQTPPQKKKNIVRYPSGFLLGLYIIKLKIFRQRLVDETFT